MDTNSTERFNDRLKSQFHTMLSEQVAMYRQPEGDDSSTQDPGFLVLFIPEYKSEYRGLRNYNRSYSHISCSSSEPRFTRQKLASLPDWVLSCGPAFIACTVLKTLWKPDEVLLQLFLQGYGIAELMPFTCRQDPLDRWFKSHPKTSIIDVREICPFLVEPEVIQAEPHTPDVHSTPDFSSDHRRQPEPKMSVASFATASSHSTFFSARSVQSSSTRRSAARGYVPLVAPEPGLPTSLTELYEEYYAALHLAEIIQPFDKELNWSGKGQHVTFTRHEPIPLMSISHLGTSMSAVVEKVLCRRIALARKTMRCSKNWTVKQALGEVYHLQKLRHFHIVQLVGTYLQGRNFSILMYPVADMHLGRFLEHVDDLDITETVEPRRFLSRALGCLASTVAFIHEQTTKHMDIKPQNILVRKAKPPFRSEWRIYLADFGLSRSFSSEDHSQTDGPTARSPRYCSPEVYNDEPRGRPADIFSLGCVFLEILCVLGGLDLQDFTDARRGDGRDESFHANLERVFEWVYMKLFEVPSDLVHKPLILLVIPMLCRDPSTRPTAKFIRSNLEGFPEGWCSPKSCCSQPQEPYTTYQPIEKRNGIHIP